MIYGYSLALKHSQSDDLGDSFNTKNTLRAMI